MIVMCVKNEACKKKREFKIFKETCRNSFNLENAGPVSGNCQNIHKIELPARSLPEMQMPRSTDIQTGWPIVSLSAFTTACLPSAERSDMMRGSGSGSVSFFLRQWSQCRIVKRHF
jgi:hypothetical protein